MANSDDDSPVEGWTAIDEALAPIYGEQEPKHWGTIIRYSLGGPDPLDGISAYLSQKDRPHWHFVSYGFSELYDKETNDNEHSGYGFELTMRTPAVADEDPPIWVASFLQNIARYVFETGNVFNRGHYLDTNGPLLNDSATDLKAIIFAYDPELPAIDTPHGQVEFLQVVGVTLDELRAAKQWNTNGLVELMAKTNPYLITDLDRKSIMSLPGVVTAVEAGTLKEGSSTGILFIDGLNWKADRNCTLELGAIGVADVKTILPARIRHGKELTLAGLENQVKFARGDRSSWTVGAEALEILVTPEDAIKLAEALQPNAGEYASPLPDLKVQVKKTEIKDNFGTVVEVVG